MNRLMHLSSAFEATRHLDGEVAGLVAHLKAYPTSDSRFGRGAGWLRRENRRRRQS